MRQKKIFILLSIAVVLFSLSCHKVLGKTCWDCDVTKMDRTNYYRKVCNDGEQPSFKDGQGNKLSSFCTKR